ncbi:Deoxyribodipyrimidine photo-lyase [Phytophthora fragariae]|uniref:Deoxyribodipyrimidine photo-lyase n=1 Tax=Phytophthora fragariae TaxID=53985 RepID=A0A6A4D2K7_9STRA|nr:Deoxyribodipyrimidine photo-lyase [Phytophthora fragariae]KAE8933443.1 Deoxyribodipyrimidine photo-lyase [Phytophthora fragariae]KAE9000284.1 Deoxyribodipyrimidine photo-lyase [Phytophthora fragariae]KAE9100191.1 Deoxyribodipyrimidine photo-lyase [Phytophthora fragariae]KAE9100960.1 Deoxyribodipyrimidine photo-lyase [Phytophthora fragariae]
MVNMRRALEKLKLPSGLHSERIQWLYEGAKSHSPDGGYLLYWMQTSVRTKHNYALEYAVAAANELKLPLHVVYLFPDRSVVPPLHSDEDDEWKAEAVQDANAHAFVTERHALFALQGLADAHERLAGRGLSFDVFHHRHKGDERPTRNELLEFCARNAALVVTDRPYLHPWRAALDKLVSGVEDEGDADSSSAGFGVVQVEGDVVVPAAVVTDKEEYAARTIRPRITKHLERYVVPLQSVSLEQAYQTEGKSLSAVLGTPKQLKPLDVTSFEAVAKTLELLDVDRSVNGVSWHFRGGEAAASACAKKFLTPDKLASYATERNEPSLDAGSDLSLYLRFGHISVVRVVLAANKLKGVTRAKEGLASFLEELIVRRELSVNLVAYNQQNYDSMRCLPNYAQITLQEHAGDKRDQLYSREKLESFQTGDRFWNAAQRELVVTGKMHGYMRMYWGKKLLEWTPTPEQGFNAALVLNNKYALDAPDPNSYAGVAWTFGKHDQGWKERPIFGKVRYMNEAGLKRKFRMDAYVLKVGRLAAKAKRGSTEEEPTEEEVMSAKPGRKKKAGTIAESDAAEKGTPAKKMKKTT